MPVLIVAGRQAINVFERGSFLAFAKLSIINAIWPSKDPVMLNIGLPETGHNRARLIKIAMAIKSVLLVLFRFGICIPVNTNSFSNFNLG